MYEFQEEENQHTTSSTVKIRTQQVSQKKKTQQTP